MKFRSLLFLLFIFTTVASAQLKLQLGESYLAGKPMKKVVIMYDDHSAWALTDAGALYVKRKTDADFNLYPFTSGVVVDDVAGYSVQHMYFTTAPKTLFCVKNGIKSQIVLRDTKVNRINGISVDWVGSRQIYSIPDSRTLDKLVLATDRARYWIMRDADNVAEEPLPDDKTYTWSFTRTGIKETSYLIDAPGIGHCGASAHSVMNFLLSTSYQSDISDEVYGMVKYSVWGYPGYGGVNFQQQLWSTEKGLFIKRWGSCEYIHPHKTLISGVNVGMIEEVSLLNSLSPLYFYLAASENGLYYTPNRVREDRQFIDSFDDVEMEHFADLSDLSIRSVTTDFQNNAPVGHLPYYDPRMICERELWIATENGARRIYMELDGTPYQDKLLDKLTFDRVPDELLEHSNTFSLCGNESLRVYANFAVEGGPLLIRWFKNGLEEPSWRGATSLILTQEGIYHSEMTAVCEQVKMKSKEIVLKRNAAPTVEFNYPAVINLCEGQRQELSTTNNISYSYRWFKNDLQISGAASPSYTATTSGRYRVELSNCAGIFISSNSVQVNIQSIIKPVIEASKANYCIGEPTVLSVPANSALQIKWYFNGVEATEYNQMNSVTPDREGSYQVKVYNASGCEQMSDTYQLRFNPKPQVVLTMSPNRLLCYGETTRLSVSDAQTGDQYEWSTGARTPSITVTRSGTYTLKVRNSFGCTNESDPIIVTIKEEITLREPPQSKVCTITGEELTLTADKGYRSYSWNGVAGNLHTLKVKTPGDYVLVVTDEMGCTARAVYKVLAWCKEIVAPNAFSPNGDGQNDTWQVGGLENDHISTLRIYNRYGAVVYSSKGGKLEWDGRLGGADAPTGVYYYVIGSGQSQKPLNGSISLIR